MLHASRSYGELIDIRIFGRRCGGGLPLLNNRDNEIHMWIDISNGSQAGRNTRSGEESGPRGFGGGKGISPLARISMKRFDLTYFRTGLIKRFPQCSEMEIDMAIREALEAMKPSRDRTRL